MKPLLPKDPTAWGAVRRVVAAVCDGITGRRRAISTRLYAVAGLLLAALAVQAGGALRVAHELKSTTDRLVQDSLGATTLVAQMHDMVLQHRRLIERAAEPRQEPSLWVAPHLDGIARMRAILREEAAMPSRAANPAVEMMRQRAVRDLVVLDLTGMAVLEQALAVAGSDGSEALQRSLRVFSVSITRFAEDMQYWREDRWGEAQALATGLRERMAQVARRAVLVALATVGLGLLGLALLRRILRQLGGITEAVLRVARHEPDIAIPARDDPGPVGDVARAVSTLAEDVLELERRGIAQARTSQLLDAALNNMTQGLVTLRPDGGLTLWNRRFIAILGLGDGAVQVGMMLPHVLSGLGTSGDLSTLAPPLGSLTQERRGVASIGRATVVRTHWVRMPDGGWLGTFEDITQLRRNEAKLVHLTSHDGLTDLPNRGVVREAVTQALAQARHGAPFALLSVTLNRMGTVNHALGQEAGDTLIRAAAERLRGQVRDADTIGRTGASTFMVVQSDVAQPSGAQAMADRLLEVLTEPYDMPDGIVVVGASIGIALAETRGAETGEADADRLIRNAELARQRARDEGGGVARFFAAEMDAHAQDRRLLELDLHRALERGEFELFYQPLISVRSRRVCAFEALLRWHHPRRGLVRPDLFIPVAEEMGLIGQIGEWVLQRACAEAATWPAHVSVAVNLSPLQFARDTLVDQVEAALAAARLDPTRLELEITESVLLRNSAGTLAMLHRLRALGVRIALDDFGTGYSSLSYLRSFPFDKIKIDKSFIQALDGDASGTAESEAIVRAILGLGQTLGVATAAEGVETVAQLRAVVMNGATEIQGYLFSPPRPASEVTRLLTVADTWPEEAMVADAASA